MSPRRGGIEYRRNILRLCTAALVAAFRARPLRPRLLGRVAHYYRSKHMHTTLFLPTEQIGTSLDRLLAPLDDVAREAATRLPTEAEGERAYCLGLLATELTIHASPSPYFYEIARSYGVDMADAQTIGRAVSGLLVRLALYLDT